MGVPIWAVFLLWCFAMYHWTSARNARREVRRWKLAASVYQTMATSSSSNRWTVVYRLQRKNMSADVEASTESEAMRSFAKRHKYDTVVSITKV